ncbi:MAG: ThiF family adenylyltransferase [Eubacterium sp.]|nr:ThiF family adenylyltransferase [Eubacterium sp.]
MGDSLIVKGVSALYKGMISIKNFFVIEEDDDRAEDNVMNKKVENKRQSDIYISESVLDEFRKNVGRYKAETGGLLASTNDEKLIDKCYFDVHSHNTPGTFYYDVDSMSKVFRKWKEKGYVTNGIYHSHPKGAIRPSYHDISTALLHIDFLKLDYFYLPILQPERRGFFQIYLYVVRKIEDKLEVILEYALEATPDGYEYLNVKNYRENHSIEELRLYRKSIERLATRKPRKEVETSMSVTRTNKSVDLNRERPKCIDSNVAKDTVESKEYFKKVSNLYPEHVLNKVIVCIGTGGARSFLENCARSGFKNYILMDADIVSPTNIATQGVFISEMGKKKVEVIRDRILDINPDANVLCVDKFLDEHMSDTEFKGYLDSFPNKSAKDYLILGCTDNFDAQKRSSILALKYGMPYLAAMMYENGDAAEIIFVYPGVTESCPRCLLRDRFEKYENGFKNDVDSSSCPIFATERMNSLKGYIALMLLMYHEDSSNPYSTMLDEVKDRNFVEIRLNPHLKDTKLGIGIFDRVLDNAAKYVYFDETLWIPQHPDRPEFGSETCKLCGGTGDLRTLQSKWKLTDTRFIKFGGNREERKSFQQIRYEQINRGLTTLPKAVGSFEAKA